MSNYVQLHSGIVIPEAQYAERIDIGKKPTLSEIATSLDGRDITRGYVDQNLIAPPTDTVLASQGFNYKVYEELARDDQVTTCRNQRELALIAKETEVQPGDDSRAAKKASDRLKDLLDRLQWDDKTQKMLGAVLYGYSVAEIIWINDGTETTIDKIKIRDRKRFGFLPNGELRMVTQAQMMSGEKLPAGKFWAFSCGADHDDEPYGRGLAHSLFWPVFFKKNGIKFWLYFLEKFGQPTAIGKYPATAETPDKDRLLQALTAIQTDSAIRIPEEMQVDLLEAVRSGTADYTELYDRMNSAISKVYLGHTGSTDATPGRLGGEDNASEIRLDLIKADADLICNSFNCTVARWLTTYNDGDRVAPPKVSRVTEPPEDKKAMAETDKVIFDMGFKPTIKHIEDNYCGDYEEHQVDEETEPFAINPNSRLRAVPTQFAEPENVDINSVASNTEQMLVDGQAAVTGLIDDIRNKVMKAKTLESLRDDLLASYADLDSDELVKVMELGFLSAELSGMYDVNEGG